MHAEIPAGKLEEFRKARKKREKQRGDGSGAALPFHTGEGAGAGLVEPGTSQRALPAAPASEPWGPDKVIVGQDLGGPRNGRSAGC